MRAIRWLQTLFAILSVPCLLGWAIITSAAVAYFPNTVISLLHAKSILHFFGDILIVAILLIATLLGWWGWYALWWAYLFYPKLARKHPKHIVWGNIAGAGIVLIQFAFLLASSFTINLETAEIAKVAKVAIHLIPVFLLFGGAPLLFMLSNMLAAYIQRKSL